MNRSPLGSFARRGAVLAVAIGLAAAGSGCSRTACFAYTQGEYEQHGGHCPSRQKAIANFSDPSCPGPVVSVESEGNYDGELCCYSVTQDDVTPEGSCQLGAGSGGFANGGVVGPDPGGFGGAGGAGGPQCLRCSALLDGLAFDPNLLCAASADLWSALTECACVTTCSAACDDNLCSDAPRSAQCTTCLEDPAMGCADAAAACRTDA